jgi:hypothetical protein
MFIWKKYLQSKIQWVLFTGALTLLFQSCQLEPNAPENAITPQILNKDGFPCLIKTTGYLDDITVSIGDYPIALPDRNGICSFGNANMPYNLIIMTKEVRTNYTTFYSYFYDGIRNTHPVIILNPSIFGSRSHSTEIIVRFPPIAKERFGIISFASKNMFRGNISRIVGPGDSLAFIYNIYYPEYYESLTGKVLFFECKGQYIGPWGPEIIKIDSFCRYGSKDVIITGQPNYVTFSPSDISFDPAESIVQYHIIPPPDVYYEFHEAKLKFEGYNVNSEITISHHYEITPEYSVVVPSALDLPFKVKIKSTVLVNGKVNYGDFQSFRSIDVPSGSSGTITHESINLASPPNNAQGVTENTMLEVNDNGEKGIYEYCFVWYNQALNGRFYAMTEKKIQRFGDLNCRAFKIYPNTTYNWYVAKLGNFNSIDEFTAEPYFNNERFNSCATSEEWQFKTAQW